MTSRPSPATATREAALQSLARTDARRGFRVAFGLLRDRGDAEDVVQEALARAAAQYGSLHDQAALPAWFLRVVTNLCMRTLRRRRLKHRALQLIGLAPAEPRADRPAQAQEQRDPRPLADDQISSAVERRRLLSAMDALPAMQKAALVLRYGEELSVAEVAEVLGVGAGTVKTHLHRGLERLRKDMPWR